MQKSKIFSGKELANQIKPKLKEKVEQYVSQGHRVPRLDTIVVGDDPASLSYIRGKHKACIEVGIANEVHHLPEAISQQELEDVIQACNNNPLCDGILLQMPLPKHLDAKKALSCIAVEKDVDGLHPLSIGKLYGGQSGFAPCTPVGIMKILEAMGCIIEGKRAVVIGRSSLVGNPVAKLLQDQNATVTICHSKTVDLQNITNQADILIAAVGRPKLITKEFVKEGAYVIDVGINRVEGKLVGDVDLDDVIDKVKMITPVPGGVGPMTICALLMNTMKAYENTLC